MNPSPSPPPSTVGLVRGDLLTSWSSWRESGEPQVFVARHTAAPTSFEDANDLTREGFTPALAQQLSEKKDPLEVMLTDVLDDTPAPPSRSIKRIREKLARTKSGLVTKKEKPLDTGKADDDAKTKALYANSAEKLSSHNPNTQAMPSKRVAGMGASSESVANGSSTEKRAPGGTAVDQTATPGPSKSKKRKSPPATDDGSGPRPRHKKQQGEFNHPAQDTESVLQNHLVPPEADASSMIPPSGQLPVEDPLTENCPAQGESQSLRLGFPKTQILKEPEATDMDQGFEFESPKRFLVEVSQRPMGQQKRVNFDISKGQIREAECNSRGDTGSAMVEPEVIISRSSSPLFASPKSQRNLPNLPRSPPKIGKRHPKFLLPKKNTPVSSSETFVEGTCTQPEDFSDPSPFGPEGQWRNATREESLPAILHNVVTALHRTLKSKEDVIGDVAREYRENALQLLDAMVSRHTSDRIESRDAHEIASHSILRAFSVAETEMKGLVSSIRALEVRRAMTSIKHTAFLEKLERVCSLYDAKLGKYDEDATGDEVADEEPGDAGPQKGNECDEAMVNEFCAALCNKTQLNDDATFSMLRKIHAEADRLLYGLPQDEGQEHRPAPVEEPVKKVDDVLFEAWNVELDVILDKEFEMGRDRSTAIIDEDLEERPAFLGVVSEPRNA
ncbi:hypothetical protein B0T18DRAFT_387841 [Schizothecium vesticola]|uniref:Uncharacterized protein n=1 Tax=Schizothecium vesticola TaxID=314040 RepID=A0AA40F5Z0_9PEZI|nr:hypothetical protein B0T18DRAFT_387841 [Schizothecium vesticola]